MKEWERARQEAQRDVRRRRQDVRIQDGVNILREPRDGRLFLLANDMPDKLGASCRFWSWAHLIIFLGAGCAGLFML